MANQTMKRMSQWSLLAIVLSGATLTVLVLLKILSGLVIPPAVGWSAIAAFFLGLAVYLIPRVEPRESPERNDPQRPHLRRIK